MDKEKAVQPLIVKEKYGTDLDGNRGIWINWIECPNCGEEIIFTIENRCSSCNQLLDLGEE